MDCTSLTLLKRRRTKIVATVGPASRQPGLLEQLVRAGVDVFRLNFSHGTHDEHRTAYEHIRAVAARLGQPIAVLADLCGPKIRVGRFAGGQIELVPGSRVVVTTRHVLGEPGLIPSRYEGLAADVRPGDRILLDDGLLELRVEEVRESDVLCTVVQGGVLKDRKGMNLPGVAVSAPSLTEQDRADAGFALELGVDLLALSFVRRAADVAELKALVAAHGSRAHVIAKIEKPEALGQTDAILDESDGIMVARGDLGVELPPEVVPIAQRQLLAQARARNKPAIVATQMLESMVEHARPTRAEVSDVSGAVFSGADAVMLSAETASGAHPVEAVRMMDRVARQVEAYQWAEGAFGSMCDPGSLRPPLPLDVTVARATAQMSRDLRVRSIIVRSRHGTTARVVSAARPAAPVIAITKDEGSCRRMSLLWGVIPVRVAADDLDLLPELARRLVREHGLATDGYLLTVAGMGTAAPAITALRL
jgi:pyruvate kinase